LVTPLEFKQHEQRLLVNVATSEKRLNGRFQQAFIDLSTTLSSNIITQLATIKQANNQPAISSGVNDMPEGQNYGALHP
jgi:hypothetical protein